MCEGGGSGGGVCVCCVCGCVGGCVWVWVCVCVGGGGGLKQSFFVKVETYVLIISSFSVPKCFIMPANDFHQHTHRCIVIATGWLLAFQQRVFRSRSMFAMRKS